MKGLTIWQPWASFIALGLKDYETRSWATSYRGPLAIHAAKRPIKVDVDMVQMISTYKAETDGAHYQELFVSAPLGAIIAVGELVDCIAMTPEFIEQQTRLERAVGFWSAGRYALKLAGVRQLPEPFLLSGRQGLWNVPSEVLPFSVN